MALSRPLVSPLDGAWTSSVYVSVASSNSFLSPAAGGSRSWRWRRDLSTERENVRRLLTCPWSLREEPLCDRQQGKRVAVSVSPVAVAAPAVATMTIESTLMHDLLACAATMAGALALLKLFDELARRNALDRKLSRKLVHVTIGLSFMLFWPLFSSSSLCPVLAALAPAGNAVRMLLLGYGVWKDEALVKAMSREGDHRELLRGPLYYAITISLVTMLFWRTSPVGIVAVVNLCAGDGFADIVGRRLGSGAKLPYNASKSYAGSLAMFVMSTVVSLLYLWLFSSLGYFPFTLRLGLGAAVVAFTAALVESLPISTTLDDNFTVPLSSILAGLLVFS